MSEAQLAQARLYLFLVLLAAFMAGETLWAARSWRSSRARRAGFHFLISAANTALYRWTILAPLLAWTALVRERGWGLAGLLGLRGAAELAATLVVFDLFDYAWHRANHQIPFFWRFHRAHHSDTHVDATTSLRFHFGELLLSGLVKCVWVGLWGPSAAALIVFEAGITACAQFHHSNFDFPDRIERFLRRVVMTPRLHAAHHTVSLRSRDANYATIFLCWDRLFGSFREADPAELESLGLETGRDSELSLRAFLLSPIRMQA